MALTTLPRFATSEIPELNICIAGRVRAEGAHRFP